MAICRGDIIMLEFIVGLILICIACCTVIWSYRESKEPKSWDQILNEGLDQSAEELKNERNQQIIDGIIKSGAPNVYKINKRLKDE